jgi:hypothetical protein
MVYDMKIDEEKKRCGYLVELISMRLLPSGHIPEHLTLYVVI